MSAAVEILQSLVRVPSVTGEEKAVAEVVAGWCERAGMSVEMPPAAPGRPNVVARRGSGRHPTTLLTGHLDTVPVAAGWSRDPFGAEIEGGRLYGLGSCDMKAGLAALLAALIDLRAEPTGDVVLAAVVGEEEDSAGTLALLAQGVDADRAILAEPTALQLVRSNRGLVNYRLTVKGESAHASSPQLGRNAIVAAAEVVVEMDRLAGELAARPHPTFGPPNLTVGTIRGGTRPYMVPDRCAIEIDRRVNPGESAETVRAEAESVVARVRERIPWLEASFEPGAEYLPFELPADHRLVSDVLAAMRASGLEPRLAAWRAASDAGFFAVRAGIPCVLFGPGDTALAHRPDEYVELTQVEAAREVCSRLLRSS